LVTSGTKELELELGYWVAKQRIIMRIRSRIAKLP